jgi:hypothetical protein
LGKASLSAMVATIGGKLEIGDLSYWSPTLMSSKMVGYLFPIGTDWVSLEPAELMIYLPEDQRLFIGIGIRWVSMARY